jgi:hypothetical protein
MWVIISMVWGFIATIIALVMPIAESAPHLISILTHAVTCTKVDPADIAGKAPPSTCRRSFGHEEMHWLFLLGYLLVIPTRLLVECHVVVMHALATWVWHWSGFQRIAVSSRLGPI